MRAATKRTTGGTRAKGKETPRKASVQYPVTSITIKNFKSISEATLDLGWFNVLVGANGSGKTAILEAIGVLGAATKGEMGDDDLLDRGVRPGVPKLFKCALASRRSLRAIQLTALSSDRRGWSVELVNPEDSTTTPWRINEIRSAKTHSLLYGARFPGGLRTVLQNYAVFDPQTAVLRGIQPDFRRQRKPVGLQGGRLAEAVASLLEDPERGPRLLDDVRELIDWVADVGVEPPSADLLSASIPALREVVRFTDKYLEGDRNKLSAYDASEGALYVLFALVLMMHPQAPVFFAVENIDHALHPRLARALVRRLAEASKSNRRQVLLTTHNPLVLDALALGDPDVRLFTVDRTVGGQTVIHRVEYSDALAKAEASGLTMSQMWIEGLLGGVPNLW